MKDEGTIREYEGRKFILELEVANYEYFLLNYSEQRNLPSLTLERGAIRYFQARSLLYDMCLAGQA